jgi:hypothetical protein
MGNHRFNEDKVKLEFDIFTYDYGLDGLPGDPFRDKEGNGIFDKGETISLGTLYDYGLDGIPDTGDIGEGDGIWQPGDRCIDGNGDGIINQLACQGEVAADWSCSGGYGTPDLSDESITEDNFLGHDIYPIPNGIWDEGEEILDCGNDGLCPGDSGYIMPDPGEGDGIFMVWDLYENDGILDTGDGLYAFEGEPISIII